ncbi:MAG: S8 family serine peptidase [Bacteroidetes bacterium]|nr:S8 family serine peptidase [Bacteroidota bacterium]
MSLGVIVLWVLSPAVYAQSARKIRDEGVLGVLLVKYEASMGKTDLPARLEVQAIEPAYPFIEVVAGKRALPVSVQSLRNVYRIQYAADVLPREAAQLVSNQAGVVYAEPLYRRALRGRPFESAEVEFSNELAKAVPNDPLFEDTAYMRRMQLTEAWDVVKGGDGDVVIAVIDDGTDWKHPDLMANIWVNPSEIADNGKDDDQNGFVDDLHGWNFSNDTADPTGVGEHGTMVAGVAGAVADNGVGMAGTSWNAQLMLINASCDDDYEFLCFTNEGVIYAALSGADIINASFGADEFSRTEADAMQAARDLGTLVIAAAPNEYFEIQAFLDFPSSLPTTLSVSGTQYFSDEVVYAHGYSVDIFAAAKSVLGTLPGGGYDRWEGTSFAVPLVSGIAALVKMAFPNFTPQQIGEQLRATADNIDTANGPSLAGLLGRGRVNAHRAVTEQNAVSVRMVDWEFTDSNGDGRFDAEEPITMMATFQSYLADVNGLNIEFHGNVPHIAFGSGSTTSTGPVQSGDSFSKIFTFTPTEQIPYRSIVFIKPYVHTLDGINVSGTDAGRLMVEDVQVIEHETRTLRFNVTSEGNIGYVDFDWLEDSPYPWTVGGFDLLYSDGRFRYSTHEVGLIVGVDPNRVSGSVFENGYDAHFSLQNTDFAPITPLEFFVSEQGRQSSRVVMREIMSRLPKALEIIQESLVDPEGFYEDLVIMRYRLVNPTNSIMEDLHVGLYFDAELHDDWAENTVGYDDAEGITYTVSPEGSPFIGLIVLSEEVEKHSRSYTWEEQDELYLPKDAWEGLSGGITYPDDQEDNWSQLVASGPYMIPAISEVIVDFAIVYGESLEDLQENARRAYQLRDSWGIEPVLFQFTSDADNRIFTVHDNYPNPFRESTHLVFDLPWPASVTVEVMDVTGRRVFTVPATGKAAGWKHTIPLSGRTMPSGLYLYRLTATSPEGSFVHTGKFVRIK